MFPHPYRNVLQNLKAQHGPDEFKLRKGLRQIGIRAFIHSTGNDELSKKAGELINILCQDTGSCILTNSHLSEHFSIQSGVRPRCLLSPVLFVCPVELLVQRLRLNTVMSRIPVPGGGRQEVKVALYTDNIKVLVRQVLTGTGSGSYKDFWGSGRSKS